ncbi:hypothetical protein ACFQVA_11445 [Actinomadura keratinilytica]
MLWPPAPSGPDTQPFGLPDGANDASLTLLVRTAGLTLLLLGDLEPPGQRALARTGRVPAGVDVLKVAHHGSAHQDPGLLAAAAPRLAVVSVGADNGYGHPAPSTLAAFRDRGVPSTGPTGRGTSRYWAETTAGPVVRAPARPTPYLPCGSPPAPGTPPKPWRQAETKRPPRCGTRRPPRASGEPGRVPRRPSLPGTLGPWTRP